MTTHEIFVKKIDLEYNEFRAMELKKAPQEIFNNYYDIYEMSEISSYLVNTELTDKIQEKLYSIPNLLNTLCEFEMNYDEPMFAKWEDIDTMIEDFCGERL